ncbi:MAG: DoxX family protein [Anaerolineae bacterium]
MTATQATTTHVVKTRAGRTITDPPIAKFLFQDTRFAPVWLVIRVLLGLTWLQSGVNKLGNPAWMQTGEALKGFWQSAIATEDGGRPTIAYDWYRSFIQSMLDAGAYTWFAKLVTIGETAVGIMLIIGAFTGVAAFLGMFMNWNYIMAGSASTNAMLMVAAVLLILAWKTAGYFGVDRWLLKRLGTPWIDPDEPPRRKVIVQ